MPPDQEQNPVELLDTEVANVLRELRRQNGLTEQDISKIAEVLLGLAENYRVMLYEHQKNHYDVIDRLKKLGLKVNREHANFQQHNKEHKTDLKTILIITKK